MSETLPNPEQQHDHVESLGELAKHERALRDHFEDAPKQEGQTAEKLRSSVEQAIETSSADKDPVKSSLEEAERASTEQSPAQTVSRELKSLTLRRELKYIRRRLPLADKALSTVIHQKVVRVVSETAGKTVSRPSGLLGGGIVAFIGTSSYLYFAKHIGLTYNYLVFIVLFVGGFAVGIAIELIIRALSFSRQNSTR